MKVISSISGLRATLIDGKFNNLLVYRYISALCSVYPKGKFVVGRDGRPSGEAIEILIAKIFSYYNREFILLGIVPTPTIQLMVEEFQAVCGISITASHNPEDWNGLKFINSQGIFFNAEENKQLHQAIESANLLDIPEEILKIDIPAGKNFNEIAIETHINKALNLSIGEKKLDINKIKERNLKITVDAINASGSVIVPKLLEQLNCEVYKINCNGNGEFVHHPEPLPEHLIELANKTASIKADIGFAVDPDGDRLVLINENGKPISEELTIVLAVQSFLELSPNPSEIVIVVNHSTTQIVEKIAEEYGATVHRAPVGEINVVEKMKEVNANIGGEGSGGIIIRDFHLGRDAIAGIVLILNLLATTGKRISQLTEELPKSVMKKVKIEFNDDFDKLIAITIPHFKREECINTDGLKFIGPDYWVQLRKSNTEPILRIIAESNSEFTTNILIDKIFGIVKTL